jgi:hypothetical protein
MRAVHVTVIGGEDDDGSVREAGSVELGQHGRDVAIDVAQAVQVVVVAPAPARFLVRDLAHHCVVRAQEIAMRRWAPGRVQRLEVARRKRELPLLRVQRIGRVTRDVRQAALRPQWRPRGVGVVEHHIVRVDEIDREEPWLAVGRQRAALAAQPARAHRRGDAVVQVAALRVGDDVADAEVVREAVRLHLLGEDP